MATYKSIRYNTPISGGGGEVLLQTQTASSDSTVTFNSNIDSIYKKYIFKFYNIHPSANNARLEVKASSNTGSSYGVTTTSSYFQTEHAEDGSGNIRIVKNDSFMVANATDNVTLSNNIDDDNDTSASGYFEIFNPSTTTFAKHYLASLQGISDNGSGVGVSRCTFVGGYYNTTSVVDAFQFVMSSGNIDAGTIKLYGVN